MPDERAQVSEFLSSDKESPGVNVNQEALRLHAHLVEKVQHADTLQTLFGYEITSDNVAQLLVAILCGLGSAVFSVQKAHQSARSDRIPWQSACRGIAFRSYFLSLCNGHFGFAG